jgi:hypothetical protein
MAPAAIFPASQWQADPIETESDGSITACTFGPFSTPVPVSELNTAGRDWAPSISADGQIVAFESIATNLVANEFAKFDQEEQAKLGSVRQSGSRSAGPRDTHPHFAPAGAR